MESICIALLVKEVFIKGPESNCLAHGTYVQVASQVVPARSGFIFMKRTSRMRQNWLHFAARHFVLKFAPRHFWFVILDFNHGDAIVNWAHE